MKNLEQFVNANPGWCAELRQRIAKLTGELDVAKRSAEELKISSEFRWGSKLLNVMTLGGHKRRS